jgi:hypothetical protein
MNMLAVYKNSHTALPSANFLDDDGETEHDTDFDPDMLTDEG